MINSILNIPMKLPQLLPPTLKLLSLLTLLTCLLPSNPHHTTLLYIYLSCTLPLLLTYLLFSLSSSQYHPPPSPPPSTFMCPTCNFVTPPSTRHCKRCKICVEGFDHHCLWFEKCVGVRNYSRFVWYCVGLLTQQTGMLLMSLYVIIVRDMKWHFWTSIALIAYSLLTVLVIIYLIDLLCFHIYLKWKNLSTYQYIMSKRQSESSKNSILRPSQTSQAKIAAEITEVQNSGSVMSRNQLQEKS